MRTDDVLDYIDQATYLSWRATGRSQLIQLVWLYKNGVDAAGVERFHRNLALGVASRLIEPSPLPFGRHRWVRAHPAGRSPEVADTRSPLGLSAWIEERSQLPVDPIGGPGWHLGVLPMSDGSTAVTLVISHCLVDGGAAMSMVADAVSGVEPELRYRAPLTRRRWAAVATDLRQTLRDAPETARTVMTAAKFAYARRREITSARDRTVPVDSDLPVVLPGISVLVSTEDWDRRAGELGGNAYALMAGYAAALGARLGRRRESDGAVSLLVAMSDRNGPEDRRANAMRIASVAVDPDSAHTDLVPAREVIRTALRGLPDDEKHALLPITPFVPKRAVRGTADVVFGDLPVSCSTLGDVPPEVAFADGREADVVMFRPIDQGVTLGSLERSGGHLVVAAGRAVGIVSIGVVGYQVGAENSRQWLSDHATAVLERFELKGTVV